MRQVALAVIVGTAAALGGCVGGGRTDHGRDEAKSSANAARLTRERAPVLNRLRDEVNAAYGFRDGAPRINLGPCGRFAGDFRARWNARFADKADIAFVMADDGSQCRHVLVRLPNGDYNDGGNGVMTRRSLLELYPDSHVEDMTMFDPRARPAIVRPRPELPGVSELLRRADARADRPVPGAGADRRRTGRGSIP